MQVTARLRYARISPQKCRLVADTVRGKGVGNALATLKSMPKKGARLVLKVLESDFARIPELLGRSLEPIEPELAHVQEPAPPAQQLGLF